MQNGSRNSCLLIDIELELVRSLVRAVMDSHLLT